MNCLKIGKCSISDSIFFFIPDYNGFGGATCMYPFQGTKTILIHNLGWRFADPWLICETPSG